jgi:hypothetical protein
MWQLGKERGLDMRYQNGIIGIVSLVLAGAVATGALYSDQFPQASSAESVGFDALAHDMLDGLFDGANAPAAGKPQ